VSDVEQRLGTRTTAETLAALSPMLAQGRFVWIMGADSFAGLHRWNQWREIPARLPLAVCDRPGWSLAALSSPAARLLAHHRLPSAEAPLLCDARPPAWVFLNLRRRNESSTRIRQSTEAPPPSCACRPAPLESGRAMGISCPSSD
jgi:nicotinate-nucleotide adenylyltransferase